MSSDGSEADRTGILNPYKKRVATGPTPPNQPEVRTVDSTPTDSNRYEVFSGQSAKVGDKAVVGHPRMGGADTYKPELDEGHDTDSGVHRLLMDPRRKGTK